MHQCLHAVVVPILLLTLIKFTVAEVNQCVDGVHNKFWVESPPGENPPLPVTLKNLVVEVYDKQKNPSCLKSGPNVVFPGYAKLSEGLLHVPTKQDLANNTYVKISARTSDKSHYCEKGVSQEWFIPDRFCKLDMCDFIGVELCNVLGEPGVHTVNELVKKANFNPMLRLPEPPCLMMLCLTDFLGGLWEVDFFIEYKGKVLLHFRIPAKARFLQIAAWDDDDAGIKESTNTTIRSNTARGVNSTDKV